MLLALQGAHEQDAVIPNERSNVYSVFSLLLNIFSLSETLPLKVVTPLPKPKKKKNHKNPQQNQNKQTKKSQVDTATDTLSATVVSEEQEHTNSSV